MPAYPMISARALGAMPRFIEAEAGPRGLDRASAAASLPIGIESEDAHFISQRSLMIFLDQGARMVGDERLGLDLARHLLPSDYGVWGAYVLSAPTLGGALGRTRRALRWHSSNDGLRIDRSGDLIRYAYSFASAGTEGYENIAYCAVGVIINIFRAYLGQAWCPERVELDLPRASITTRTLESFACEVRPGAACISVLLRPDVLAASPAQGASGPAVTLADVHRARAGGAPRRFPAIVRELVRTQLVSSAVSLEAVAESLAVGPRTLQRELEADGACFRDIVGEVRLDRAKELLAENDLSITRIGVELGYSASTHFSRAFHHKLGLSPKSYRNEVLGTRASLASSP